MISRRQAIGSLLASATAALEARRALASARPAYGSRLRLTLPIDVSRVDPHVPALTPRLLGAALFECLYARPPLGAAYPTLAAALPKRSGRKISIELRPGLRSGRGARLDAAAVVQSLTRSQLRAGTLGAVERMRAVGSLEIELTTALDEAQLALELSRLSCAIVPPGFDPTSPDCTGSLRSQGAGIRRLVRNGWAPRGGSYLDEVVLTSADLRTCLRDFETLRSEASFLGSGLHQGRSSATAFALGPLGWLVLLPGKRLGRFAAPGVLSQALGGRSSADFAALGVSVPQGPETGGWTGPPCSISVDESEPWLMAIAGEVARAWDSPRARVRADPIPRAALELR
jgi:peptide/nickel transport system substrate-binding protein